MTTPSYIVHPSAVAILIEHCYANEKSVASVVVAASRANFPMADSIDCEVKVDYSTDINDYKIYFTIRGGDLETGLPDLLIAFAREIDSYPVGIKTFKITHAFVSVDYYRRAEFLQPASSN